MRYCQFHAFAEKKRVKKMCRKVTQFEIGNSFKSPPPPLLAFMSLFPFLSMSYASTKFSNCPKKIPTAKKITVVTILTVLLKQSELRQQYTCSRNFRP